MKSFYSLFFLLLSISLCITSCTSASQTDAEKTPIPTVETTLNTTDSLSKSIYDYSFTTVEGKNVPLGDFKGKKILLVNTASECGFTGQYKQLQEISQKYEGKLVVIGFPCDQFGGQEPGRDKEIKTFCEKNYGVTFLLSQKIDVKGINAHPIWKWLTEKDLNNNMDSDVKWNFQKYLISEAGHLISVYNSTTKPDAKPVQEKIEG